MTVDSTPRRGRWARRVLIISVVLALVCGVAALYVLRAVPDYRTAFLVDTSLVESGKQFRAVADAVGSAAQNSADGDSLSLRRFGGECGDGRNTVSVVGPGTGHAQRISTSAHALTPSGKPTLKSGLLAGIGDFSGYYPLRGSKRNRVVVVTSHGVDACTADQASVRGAVRRKARDSGVQLDFRFVGYKVPRKEQRPLARLAEAADAARPRFVDTPGELAATLKQLTVPGSPEARHIDVPSTATTSPPPRAAARLSLSTATLKPGGTCTATAAGMEPGEPVVFTWTGPSGGSAGTFTARRKGAATARIQGIEKPGWYTVRARGQHSARTASARLRVVPADKTRPRPSLSPKLVLKPSTLSVGESTTATASGFRPGEIVNFYLGPWGHSGSYAQETANASGVAVARLGEGWGLAEPGGVYRVTAVVTASRREAHAELRYEKEKPTGPLTAQASPDPVAPGGTVTVTGGGFAPNRNVQYSSDLFPGNATTASETGSIEFSATVPTDAAAGDYIVHIAQTASGSELTVPIRVKPATPTPTRNATSPPPSGPTATPHAPAPRARRARQG
ncbi:hypothetical protein GCM10010103_19700 [Streptomyces paradoxus]|uniref:Putative RNA binding protein YcfA (HicA-like mRNA interferase family) n=1 Tax=Streptomyces paradoxus TaxID=66375 RepID=A0A7W9TCJ0_9ACTN|nr:hypothetical protein [Streptomyces paradoxus]MBB6076982.1 putative RNA binding protein YcfA (HicA-like mRNA interferase family) [Streptomyces paradoxus]